MVFKTVIALIVLRFEKGMMYRNQINECLKAASCMNLVSLFANKGRNLQT